MSARAARKTEVEAYGFINSELGQREWDTRSPSNTPPGHVYKQNQCLSDPEIRKWLESKKPENIVKVDETSLWVIEAKAKRTDIDKALDEAENYYAARLNKSDIYKVMFITGVAGNNDDGFIVKNRYYENGKYKPIIVNDKETTALLSRELALRIIKSGTATQKAFVIDRKLFMQKADTINEILHIGAVNINDRARVMAALLLSTMDDDDLNLNSKPKVLINDINARVESVLTDNGKANFFGYVRLDLPTAENHVKYRQALVDTLKELYSLDIKSAMNSDTDLLGQFYEVFLKYGNWAQKMGIVLTPRHVTKFAAEVLDVGLQDYVLDPTCGTGGFLVSAFDRVKSSADNAQLDQFKENNMFGIDLQSQLACLAIVNMIFRGDGKNNIKEGDCFANWIVEKIKDGVKTAEYKDKEPDQKKKVITKVLMNPPFAIKSVDIKEYRYVQHALNQMAKGGLIFCILPLGAMFEQGDEKEWRQNTFLEENTLLAVITLHHDLFLPSADVHTLCIIAKRGTKHPRAQKVLWARAVHDGHVVVKGRRLPSNDEPDDLATLLPIVRAFVHDPSFPIKSVPEFYKVAPIDFTDPLMELVPEAYIDSKPITSEEIQEGMERLVRENVAFMVKFKHEGSSAR